MKKLLATLLSIITIVSVLSICAFAASTEKFDDDYVADGEIVFASFNSVKSFIADSVNPEPLEDACFWLSKYADKYNIGYVSFIGHMSSEANFTYENYYLTVNPRLSALQDVNQTDEECKDDFRLLKSVAESITNKKIPYGISIGLRDYAGVAMFRLNHVESVFRMSDFVKNTDCKYYEYNANNFAVVVESDGVEYIVYQMETCPRTDVLNWFNSVNEANVDKRAIVYTSSFLRADGTPVPFWNWEETNGKIPADYREYGTQIVTNILNDGMPRDGIAIWDYSLSKWDNLSCIVSTDVNVGTDIITTKLTNSNGHEVVAVLANLEGGYASSGEALPLLVKLNPEGTEVDVCYASAAASRLAMVSNSRQVITIENPGVLKTPSPFYLLPKITPQINGDNKAYIYGVGDKLFAPDRNITKAEACAIFARLILDGEDIPKGNTTKFTDVTPDKWYYDSIAFLDANGFFFNKTSSTYNPEAKITRGEFAELAYFASDIATVDVAKFPDVNEENPYYTAINSVADAGIVAGYPDGTFGADNNITRAEVVTITNRVLGLVATEKTIAKDRLENNFSDILGHWAEYEVLMASNDQVHTPNYYTTDSSKVTITNEGIELKNKRVKISLSEVGAVEKIVNLENGEDITGVALNPYFFYAKTPSGTSLFPLSIEMVNGRLKMEFIGDIVAYVLVDVRDDFFIFELDSELPDTVDIFAMGNMTAEYEYSLTEADTFRLSGVAMHTNVSPNAFPGGDVKSTKGDIRNSFHNINSIGGRYAVAFSNMTDHREILKDIMDEIDREVGLTSTHTGAYSLDHEDVFEDYGIWLSSGALTVDNAAEAAEYAKEYDVDLIDIHTGTDTFLNGSFDFVGAATKEEKANKTFISAETYKERLLNQLYERGVGASLHTMSAMIHPNSVELLTDPVMQQGIIKGSVSWTLTEDVSNNSRILQTSGDVSGIIPSTSVPAAPYGTTQYFLIDEEIFQIVEARYATKDGFINVKRGALGTTPAEHKAGAKIYQLKGGLGGFMPIPGSELFYEVARRTAKAANDGGFEMIFFDGLEAITKTDLFTSTERWFWMAEFVRETLEHLEKDIIIEYSTFDVFLWGGRSRGGAWDYPHQNYKEHNVKHIEDGLRYPKMYLAGTLGWWDFAPSVHTLPAYQNLQAETMFRDDLDHMGSLMIAYNSTMVINPFGVRWLETPVYKENAQYFSLYTKLRKAGYFAEEVKEELKNGEYEFKVIKLDNGDYAFREMNYVKHIVTDLSFEDTRTGKAYNPFSADTPYIRIEQRHSAGYYGEVVLLPLDETVPATELAKEYTIGKININSTQALKVKVLGNGKEGSAMVLKITNASSTADYRTYIIPTDHEGWREITLAESDYPVDFGYDTDVVSYSRRALTDMSIGFVGLYTVGDVSGVLIDDIRCVRLEDGAVENPSITIGGKTMTFNCKLSSGEYIEYYPETGKAYLNGYDRSYDRNGIAKTTVTFFVDEISYTGSLTVPAGEFEYTYNAKSLTEFPVRAEVTIGLHGRTITNPDGWDAPAVEYDDKLSEIIPTRDTYK